MKLIDYLVHPVDKTELTLSGNELLAANGEKFRIENGIYQLLPNLDENYIEHYQNDAELFDYFAESPDKVQIHDDRRVREYICNLIGNKAGNLLDIGSGGGWVAEYLSSKADSVTFTDISLKNLAGIQTRFPMKNANYVQADSMYPPFKAKSFDTVVASEVIEHTVDPTKFIGNLLSLLKPGGKLIISTPYKEKIQYYLCIHCNKPTPRNAHLHSFDECKLRLAADRFDFKSMNHHIFGNKVLIFSRSYILLQYLPFAVWKIFDKLVSYLVNKNAHIILEIEK